MEEEKTKRCKFDCEKLPEELIIEILSYCSVKFLLCCKCVCKSWYSLINSPQFIKQHLTWSQKSPSYLINTCTSLSAYPCSVRYDLIENPDSIVDNLFEDPDSPWDDSSDDDSDSSDDGFCPKSPERQIVAVAQEVNLGELIYVEEPKPRITRIFPTGDYDSKYVDMVVVGSIDGLVCLAYNDGTCVVIWNPSTRESFQVPDPQIAKPSHGTYSFGFAQHNGYKVVVRVITPYYANKPVTAEVYDCQTTCWTEFLNPPQMDFSDLKCATILNGIPYWPSDNEVLAKAKSKLIIWYDPKQNQFNDMKRPEFESDEDCYIWTIGTSGNALVVLMQIHGDQLHVWMKEDEVYWKRQFTVGLIEGIKSWVGCWKKWEFLASGCRKFISEKMQLYDAQCKEIKSITEIAPECITDKDTVYVNIFSESLVSPWPPIPVKPVKGHGQVTRRSTIRVQAMQSES